MNKYKIKSFKSEEIINADIVDILETGHIAFYKHIEGTEECELVAAFPSDFSFIKLAIPDKMTPKDIDKVIDKIPDYIAKTKAPESVGLNFKYDEDKANTDLQKQFEDRKKKMRVVLPEVPISKDMNEAQEQSETKHYRKMHSALDKFREEELKKKLDAELKFTNDARTEDLFNQQKLNDDIDTLINKEFPQPEEIREHDKLIKLPENITADFNELPETVETKNSVIDKELTEFYQKLQEAKEIDDAENAEWVLE